MTHTKECGYLGLPQDTNMHCKNPNLSPVLASSAPEGQGVPCSQVPDDEPETMKRDFANAYNYNYNSVIKWPQTHVQFYPNTTLELSGLAPYRPNVLFKITLKPIS
jgi:hypothetical protein